MRSMKSDVVVVGAGIAGVMTVLYVRRRGHPVTLIDRWEPGHSRASSTDYTRIIRTIHGPDRLYTQWVRETRLRWMELQEEIQERLYVECGTLVLANLADSDWEDATLPVFDSLGVPYFKFGMEELAMRFPQCHFKNVVYGIYAPESGLIMAHRAVVETARQFVREGGRLQRGRVVANESERLYLDGRPLEAGLIIVAAGPCLGEMFRRTIAPISQIVRQNFIYASTPDSDIIV